MKKIRTPRERAGEALPVRSTNTSNRTAETPPKAVLSRFSGAADHFIAASQSAATKRAYASDLRHFFANGGSIPASPAVLAEYLASSAEKLSVATLERRLTAIHKAHLEKNLSSPALSESVKRVMQGIRRTLGTRQRQVTPLVKDDLLAALVMVNQQTPVKAARDRALLLVGFASAMRRSELVGVNVEHITHLPTGMEIFLPCSKTDQDKRGRTVFIPHANDESRCPVKALIEWLAISGIRDGAVFRAVTRYGRVAAIGLSSQSVALIVKASVARAGGDADQSSGHSLRAGYCTSAAEKGLQPWQIREQTGHKSDVTLAKYIRPVARRRIPSLL